MDEYALEQDTGGSLVLLSEERAKQEPLWRSEQQRKGGNALERELTDISFEAWGAFVFEHPVPDPQSLTLEDKSKTVVSQPWYLQDDCAWWNPSRQPEVTIAYLTNLFEDAPEVLAAFSAAQVNQGLGFLSNPACSDHLFALFDPAVDWSSRERCIEAIFTLFKRFLAVRCSPHLAHLDEPGANPLNEVCYMWWDVFPTGGRSKDPHRKERGQALLDVMRRCLDLPSDACRESALHGLGHWHSDSTEAIIAQFLKRNSTLRPELRAYALTAQRGFVL